MESRFEPQLKCSKTSLRHSHMSETWDVFTLCVNISISLSTEYLHRLYVICSWDKSSWCDLQIRKKILRQQLFFGNTLCLFVAFRRSEIAIYKINFTVRRHKKKSYGHRPFSICAPKLWNDLPLHLRNCSSFNVFKSNLKTFLLKYKFCLWCVFNLFSNNF